MLSQINPLASSLLFGVSVFSAVSLAQPKILDANKTILPISATGHDRLFSVAFDKDGNYYAAGSVADSTDRSSDSKFVVAKFLPSGSLDSSFGSNGYAIHNIAVGTDGEAARGIVISADGKIVVAGAVEHAGATDARDRDLAVVRLNADGSLDSSFGTAGVSILDLSPGTPVGEGFVADGFGSLNQTADGKLLVHGSQKRDGGFDLDFALVRLNADGSYDQSFGTAGKVTVDLRNLGASPKATVLLPDGKILATGYTRDTVGNIPVIYRVDTNGVIDTTYGNNGIFAQPVLAGMTEVYSAVLQGDSIVTVGYGRNNNAESLDFVSLRVTADGQLDTTYGTDGYVQIDAAGYNDNGRNMTLLPDGRLVLIGGGRATEANVDGMVVVLNPSGEVDYSFGENGTQLFDFGTPNDFLWGVAVSPAGDKLVAVGIKGVGNVPGNDDAAIVSFPIEAAN